MGKLSALPTETTFGSTDFLVKVKAAGGGDVKVLTSDFVKAISVPSLLRRAPMILGADNSGGASMSQLEANDISFTGTPTNYGRIGGQIPMDYLSGTTATINLLVYSASTNNQTVVYYIGSHGIGAFTTWNIASSLTTTATLGLTATNMVKFTFPAISAGSLTAGNFISMAFRPSAAITGTIVVVAAYIEYTAIL